MKGRRFIPISSLNNVEQLEYYVPGGLHPISIGDSFENGRYKVLHKLGHGSSSTIWLVRDQEGPEPGRLVALKALCADISDTSRTELTIYHVLQATLPPVSGLQTVERHFRVDGPNGTHLFLVSPFAGPSIHMMFEDGRRLHADLARKVVKQLVRAVQSMHCAGVVHGDITTANVLFCLKPHILKWSNEEVYATLGMPETEQVKMRGRAPLPPGVPEAVVEDVDKTPLMSASFLEEKVILADFGESFVASSPPADYEPATQPHYLAPEACFDGVASFETDIWELGCAIFEIRTGFPLFQSLVGSTNEILKHTVMTFGRLPDPWWEKFGARGNWFTEDGQPKSFEEQERAGIFLFAYKKTIHEKLRSLNTTDRKVSSGGGMFEKPGTEISEEEVELLADLLEKMLRYRPEDRIGLSKVIEHPWLGM